MEVNHPYKRIVTHTDFDGIISALLLREVFKVQDIVFTEPSNIQKGHFKDFKSDIVCDLPKAGGMWFDHHPGQTIDAPRKCFYDPKAKSCARIIYEKFKDKLAGFRELVDETDKIDSASFTKEEYLNPNACGRISITLRSADRERDDNYRVFILNMLSFQPPEAVARQSMVQKRYFDKIDEWKKGDELVAKQIELDNDVAVVDLVAREEDAPAWRIHKVYLDYPEVKYVITAHRLKISGDVKMSCGTNIFQDNDSYPTHIGEIMKEFGGGGHKGIGGCTVKAQDYQEIINKIKEKLRT